MRPQRSVRLHDRQSAAGDLSELNPTLARRAAALILVSVVLALALYVRLRLADAPLERDEGEYAYAGQLILQGIAPYRLAYNMKFPGTYYAYSVLLAAFGQNARAIRVGLTLIDAASALIVFLLGRRLLGWFGGAAAAAAFTIMALDRWVLGVFAHATHFALLPALAGLLFLLRAEESRAWHYAAAGALLGVAVLMKQHAVFLAAFGALMALRAGFGRACLVVAGIAASLLTAAAVLAGQGVFGQFVFWTVQYAKEYVSERTIASGVRTLAFALAEVSHASRGFWLLAAGGLATIGLARTGSRERLWLIGLSLASFATVVPGFYFRDHYFVLMLPAIALLVGAFLEYVGSATLALMLFAGALGAFVIRESDYLFSESPREVSRAIYGENPFIEAVEVGDYLRTHTQPNERIAVIGSEPEIYFYAQRKSATGYIYMYALMEPQPYASRMQEEMIAEIEQAQPNYVVRVTAPSSWDAKTTSDDRIVRWADAFTQQCYEPVDPAALPPSVLRTFHRRAGVRDCRAPR
jgi:hypothetical protein